MVSRLRVALLSVCTLARAASGSAQTETVTYMHTDGIGSVRMLTNESAQVIARFDYLPFGEPCTTACGVTASTATSRQFAGKEKDSETGLDYFGGRYLAVGQGRFTSVDPVLDLEQAMQDPQRWNRYHYVQGNPLRFVDPDGRQGVESALARDERALLKGEISKEEFNARIAARGAGAVAGLAVLAGPLAWRAAVGCVYSVACQAFAIGALEGIAGGPPRIIGPTGDIDPAANALAGKLGGLASVAVEGFGNREFDAISAKYVAQTFGGDAARLKPGNFLSAVRRQQIRATLEAAKALGKKAYFEFRNGVHDDVLDFIRRNAERLGVEYDVSK